MVYSIMQYAVYLVSFALRQLNYYISCALCLHNCLKIYIVIWKKTDIQLMQIQFQSNCTIISVTIILCD